MVLNLDGVIMAETWCRAAQFLRKPVPVINRNLSRALRPPRTSDDCAKIVAARRFFDWLPGEVMQKVGYFHCQYCGMPIVIGNKLSFDLHRTCRAWMNFYQLPIQERSAMLRQYRWKCTAFFSQNPRPAIVRNLSWIRKQPLSIADCARSVAAYLHFDGLDPQYASMLGYIFCRHCGLPDLLNNQQAHDLHRRCWAWLRFYRFQASSRSD